MCIWLGRRKDNDNFAKKENQPNTEEEEEERRRRKEGTWDLRKEGAADNAAPQIMQVRIKDRNSSLYRLILYR
jgi:hypothetical protein